MKLKQIISDWIGVNRAYFKNLKDKRTINNQTKYSSEEVYDLVHESPNSCFVLSTGRCGTKLLTAILEGHPDAMPLHQPQPELLYFDKLAYRSYKSDGESLKRMIDIASYEQVRKAFLLEKHFIETHSGITFFAHQLAALYPNAKFIHLVRKPESFVRSGYSRAWYEKDFYSSGDKIRPGKESGIDWEQYSAVAKIAWLWNETNQFIEDFKSSVNEDRVLTIRSEDLFNDVAISEKIFNFLNLHPISRQQIKKIISKKINKQYNKKTIPESEADIISQIATLQSKYY